MITYNYTHPDIAPYIDGLGSCYNPLNHPATSSNPPFLLIEGKHAGGNLLEARYQLALIATSCINIWREWAGDDAEMDVVPAVPGIAVVGHHWSLFWHYWDGEAVIQVGGALCGDTTTLLGTWQVYSTMLKLEAWGKETYWPKIINLLQK
ncbi:hypothetical protein BGX38DRAFT_908095 [Terfezia claveryi]|nr:hypothetical protein BGX38DRAFT_908095 [Terfezia claveryi]